MQTPCKVHYFIMNKATLNFHYEFISHIRLEEEAKIFIDGVWINLQVVMGITSDHCKLIHQTLSVDVYFHFILNKTIKIYFVRANPLKNIMHYPHILYF